ncbi:hypothetical protein MRX96_024070 [Rhipicephalus microplus]
MLGKLEMSSSSSCSLKMPISHLGMISKKPSRKALSCRRMAPVILLLAHKAHVLLGCLLRDGQVPAAGLQVAHLHHTELLDLYAEGQLVAQRPHAVFQMEHQSPV